MGRFDIQNTFKDLIILSHQNYQMCKAMEKKDSRRNAW